MSDQVQTKPQFDDNKLQCPHCTSIYTHQGQIEVFERQLGEEKGNTINYTIRGALVAVNEFTFDNPSRDRQGIRILFFCENCHKRFWLTIAQDRGNTMIVVEDFKDPHRQEMNLARFILPCLPIDNEQEKQLRE